MTMNVTQIWSPQHANFIKKYIKADPIENTFYLSILFMFQNEHMVCKYLYTVSFRTIFILYFSFLLEAFI